ncbi:uncharacterized protein LOC114942446 [Nylanderia fulva]|uniref:uncharacterized protein LOC114942446 n=1 Tax=Nylanderia fulva TaxID=613905 RepID=UPI0010FB2AF4|nr:uncharacterized protein LOC114942446 [Nylanderia fulva]
MMCPNCRHRFPASEYCQERNKAETNLKETEKQEKQKKKEGEKEKETCYVADLLVSHSYTNGDSNFINLSTIVHEPTVFQSAHCCSNIQLVDSEIMKLSCDAQMSAEQNPFLKLPIDQSNNQDSLFMTMKNVSYGMTSSEKHATTTCKPTDDGITFTTSPNIYSGGCLIQSTEAGILVQAPPIEIQRKFTGGGCLVEKKRLPIEDERLAMFKYMENFAHQTFVTPPSSCLELPGRSRKILSSSRTMRGNSEIIDTGSRQRKISIGTNDCCKCYGTIQQNLCQCHKRLSDAFDDSLLFKPIGNSIQIRVNANSQLPVNLRECRINITAKTAIPSSQIAATKLRAKNKQERNDEKINSKETKKQEKQKKDKEEKKEKEAAVHSSASMTAKCYVTDLLVSHSYTDSDSSSFINVPPIIREPAIFQTAHCFNAQFAEPEIVELSNNFNETIATVQSDNLYYATENRIFATGNNGCNNNEQKDETISVPHPWVMSSPWSLDTKLLSKDIRLCEMKRLLQTCGWYHENISWKQSENLLKDMSVGRWLMRDSSDSRYIFAISVQTARGPTSVRVCYFLQHFQFDAEPGLALAIPTFDCPITMLEHYVEYSKRMDRREVWVDYSGQLYSQIYLTKPLMKEVKSLSHLARLVVNRNKLPTEHLPLLIRNYLAEYSYTL